MLKINGKKYYELKKNYLVDEIELAYMAGIIDGEGSIFLANESNVKKSFVLRVSVSSTDRILIDWINDRFDGNTCVGSKNKHKPNYSTAYHWRTTGPRAAKLLEALRNFLVIKKAKADFAIAFQGQKNKRGEHPLTKEKIELYEKYKKEIKNARYY
jgi:hypothetical protein